ncbi:MAG: pilus assembly protein N-terminal domain-containing protein [Polyangiaceae bacterium]
MNPIPAFALLGVAALCAAPRTALAQARADRSDAATADNAQTITLAIGETKVISAKDVKNYSEGVTGIIDIKLTSDASQFVVNGRRAGSTTLLLIKNDGSQTTINIDVFVRAPQVVERELSQLLTGLSGVQVRRVGAHIVIDGRVADEEELKRVAHVASLYPGQVDSLVVLGAGGAPVVAPGETQRYVVRIDFYFVQYDANSSYNVGIAWPGAVGGSFLQSSISYDFLTGVPRTATATLANQPLPGLDIASARGWAKVLKQATIVTNNGIEASFSNGGEQNFTVTTGLGVGVQKIPFGTEVTVLPKYNPQQRQIDVKISADVADLTAAVSGTSLPGRTTSKLSTNISVKLGQTIVLSGIRSESTTHSVSGIPILKDIPVLGLLFGAHSNDVEATEGAVFIVPSVIEAVPTSAQELVQSALVKFRTYSGAVESVNAYDKRPGGGLGLPAAPVP